MTVDDFVENMNTASPDINKAKTGDLDLKQEIQGAEPEAVLDTEFYLSEEEFNDQRMLNRLNEANN